MVATSYGQVTTPSASDTNDEPPSEILRLALLRQTQIIRLIERDQSRGIDGYINIMRNASLRGMVDLGTADRSENDGSRETMLEAACEQMTGCHSEAKNKAQHNCTPKSRAGRLQDVSGSSDTEEIYYYDDLKSTETDKEIHLNEPRTTILCTGSHRIAKQSLKSRLNRAQQHFSSPSKKVQRNAVLLLPHDFKLPTGCLLGTTWLPSHMMHDLSDNRVAEGPLNFIQDQHIDHCPSSRSLRFCHIFVPAEKLHEAYKRQTIIKFIHEYPADLSLS